MEINNKKNENEKKVIKVINEIKDKYDDLILNDKEYNALKDVYLKYIETTEGTSNRRILINTGFFFIFNTFLLTSSIFFILSFTLFSFIISAITILSSFLWLESISKSKKINSSKFKIMKIVSEKLIKVSLFDDEYLILDSMPKGLIKSKRLTKIESLIPWIYILFSLILFIFSFVELFF